jgi:predicted secreted protein
MSNPTSNFGWQMPTPQDLVTDLPADFEVFGQAVDTDLADLLGGTTGQVLSKTSATDLAFTWVDANPGDITGVTAGTGLTGGGTSGTVTLDIDSTVSTLTGTQTLTNKTLTAPIINLSFNPQTGTSYTLVSGDSGKLVTLSNAAAITLTIPPSIFTAGEQINLQSIGAGLTTFAAGAGVTITSTGATPAAPILRAQYSAATVICTASDVFTIIGDLA